MNKILIKILLVITSVVFIAGSLLLTFFLIQQISVMRDTIFSSYLSMARVTAESVQRGYLIKNWPLESLNNLVDGNNILFCWVTDDKGVIQMAGRAKYFGKIYKDENLKSYTPRIKKVIFKGKLTELISYPVFINRGYPWTLYLGVSLKQLTLIKNKTIAFGLVVFLLVLSISILLSILLTRPLIYPILELTKMAEQLAQNKFPPPLKLKNNDETKQLADSFNKMAENFKELEEALKKKAERLEKTLKLKSDFLHIINHQLRTPISILRGYLAFWKDGSYKKFPLDKQEEMRRNIIVSADRLANLTNAMMKAMEVEEVPQKMLPNESAKEFEEEESGLRLKIEPVDLKNLILEIYQRDLKSLYQKKGISFEINAPEKFPLVETDSRYVSIVIQNLLNNAWEFTSKGGVKVNLKIESNFVIIEVKDTGIGLTEEDKKRLFKRFSRGEISSVVAPSGTGLGLYICQKIVSLLNGKIEAHSKGRNQGATFLVRLPIKYKG